MSKDNVLPSVIVAANGWGGYLASHLYPGTPVIYVSPGMHWVQVAHQVLRLTGAGPTVLLHIDISLWGEVIDGMDDFIRLIIGSGGSVWNGRIRDTRKSSMHRVCRRNGLPSTQVLDANQLSPQARVMIKTDVNALGRAEFRLEDTVLQKLGLGNIKRSRVAGMTEYPTMTVAEVPAELWQAPELLIERFVERRDGLFFRVFMAGENCILCEGKSQEIVKRINRDASERRDIRITRSMYGHEELPSIISPQQQRAFEQAIRFADAFGLDFGSLDLLIDEDNEIYIVDVNPTPYWGDDPVYTHFATHLGGLAAQPA
ncbi:hypothetical protein [Parachitinimonas caeni]|uniref:ATP-grasp domain-containing protein n=1 Tax=Parachitinimonas caeni TaxID=3031301 RepID=A0ABT7DZK7_9NEIS|nr:hypothetical protein [Parachitinimonas caeni]MDK2125429.1 hypothetical protein [Parachitinimonas caeni]